LLVGVATGKPKSSFFKPLCLAWYTYLAPLCSHFLQYRITLVLGIKEKQILQVNVSSHHAVNLIQFLNNKVIKHS